MAVYLDCAATTPIDPRVRDEVLKFLDLEFGNAGSRTHEYGARARRAVERARDQVAAAVGAGRGDVIFTSGATESNNLAIQGLAAYGREQRRMHLVGTMIEHHAVLEPLRWLASNGFELTLVQPTPGGWVDPQAVRGAIRPDTLLVSVMHANNETSVIQPIEAIAALLADHPAYLHVDAAQTFGRETGPLRHPRVDLISVSGHKIHAPKGVGALITRRRNGQRPPLISLMHGGGQERGLRPGTLPVQLIVGLGLATELATTEADRRAEQCRKFRVRLLESLKPLHPLYHGDQDRVLPHVVNFSLPGIDSEEAMEALQDEVAISNGAACTSQSMTCSHVLGAMGLDAAAAEGAMRWSWCHLTPDPDWRRITEILGSLLNRQLANGNRQSA